MTVRQTLGAPVAYVRERWSRAGAVEKTLIGVGVGGAAIAVGYGVYQLLNGLATAIGGGQQSQSQLAKNCFQQAQGLTTQYYTLYGQYLKANPNGITPAQQKELDALQTNIQQNLNCAATNAQYSTDKFYTAVTNGMTDAMYAAIAIGGLATAGVVLRAWISRGGRAGTSSEVTQAGRQAIDQAAAEEGVLAPEEAVSASEASTLAGLVAAADDVDSLTAAFNAAVEAGIISEADAAAYIAALGEGLADGTTISDIAAAIFVFK